MTDVPIPSVKDLYTPVLQALHSLGGEGSNEEINKAVVEMLNLSPDQLSMTYKSAGSANKPVCEDRIGWARSHLKIAGLIEQPRRKVWRLTEEGRSTRSVEQTDVYKALRARKTKRESEQPIETPETPVRQTGMPTVDMEELFVNYTGWREQLIELMYQMPASQLERFFRRIFKSEGIDRVDIMDSRGSSQAEIEGTMTSDGFLTFRVAFKFIRGNRQIIARHVEDFRRQAQVSAADKGLLITTGTFTQEASREAARRSSPKIELIGGEELIDKLKELGLGVSTRQVLVEQVFIDEAWFREI